MSRKAETKMNPCWLHLEQNGEDITLVCPYGTSQARMLLSLIESNTDNNDDLDMRIEDNV